MLLPRQPSHHAKVAFAGQIQKPERRNRVSADGIDAAGSHQPKVSLDERAVMKFHTPFVRTERAVCHTPNPELVIASVKKLAAHARALVPAGGRRLFRDSVESIGQTASSRSGETSL